MDLCNTENIRSLMERHGFRFSKSMGQNFLIENWVPQEIAEKSGICAENGVLEIGPGIGCLTQELSQAAAKVAAVELDRRLLPVLSESLKDCKNVRIINGDIMKLDIPSIIDEHFSGLRPCVCANLPYNITTPVLSKLIDSGLFETITVMVQREVARRICSMAGTPDYGAFTVYVNYHMSPEILFDVPPDCFMPRPKVYSSVIKLTRRTSPAADIDSEKVFFSVVRGAFAQRRKTLANSLSSSLGGSLTKSDIVSAIKACGLAENVRGETLDIKQFAMLSNIIGGLMK